MMHHDRYWRLGIQISRPKIDATFQMKQDSATILLQGVYRSKSVLLSISAISDYAQKAKYDYKFNWSKKPAKCTEEFYLHTVLINITFILN